MILRMIEWIERMAALGPRRTGSAADRACEDWLAGELAAFGLERVRKEPIPVRTWEATDARVDAGTGTTLAPVDAHWAPFTEFTPPGGVEGPLLFTGPGPRGDWRGKIVAADIRFPPINQSQLKLISMGVYDPADTIGGMGHAATWVRLNWHLYGEAVRRGAIGFLGIVRDQPGGSSHMFAPYGFREQDIHAKPIPMCWVARSEGDRLRDVAAAGGRARIILRGERAPGVTHNIVGEIPGTDDRETMVLTCHHDSPFASPVEDATGCAAVLELARRFSAERGLRRRLVVVFTAGHFYGSIGTREFIRTHAEDVVARCAAEFTIEHIALEAEEDAAGRLVPTGRPEPAGLFVPFSRAMAKVALDAVAAHDLDRTVLLPPEGPLGNYPPTDGGDWHEAGVPTFNLISNPVYLLTDEDALRWVAVDRLPKVVQTFDNLMRRLDRIPREDIARVDCRVYRATMRALGWINRARTTRFGSRPVY